MNRQIRNIANVYMIVMGLVLLLLLFISIRVVDVYYNNEAKGILETRATQLESIYTNYSEAEIKLRELNDEYIDRVLYTRLEGVYDIIRKTTPGSKDLSLDYESMFEQLDGHRIDLVPSSDYAKFMSSAYGIEVTEYSDKIAYFSADVEGRRWRVAARYIEEKDAVLVVSEDVSAVDYTRSQFEIGISERIEEHMQREPMNVSIIVVAEDRSLVYCSEHQGNHEKIELLDMRTGKAVFDLVSEIENGQLEYQIKTDDGFKDYFAFTRASKEYDAYLILSMEKKDLATRFGNSAGMFLKMIFVLLVGFSIWTVYRFKSILGNDFAIHHKSSNDKNSIF